MILLSGHLVAVYEDNNQFNHKYDVLLREIISPKMSSSFFRIIASNMGHVFVATSKEAFRLVWSAADLRRSDDPIGISSPHSMSMSIGGYILIPTNSPPRFDIRKPDGILSVNLPSYMHGLAQVVEISPELFVIVYKTREHNGMNIGNILKLKANGEFELRSKSDDRVNQPDLIFSLARYSSDRVIAADARRHRVILLDSELNTQYTLLKCRDPLYMCYKKDKRQLVVGHSSSPDVDVFTFDDENHYKLQPAI